MLPALKHKGSSRFTPQGLLSLPLCHCLSPDASLSLSLNFFHKTGNTVPGYSQALSSTARLLIPSTNVWVKGSYGLICCRCSCHKRKKKSLHQSSRISFLMLEMSSPFGCYLVQYKQLIWAQLVS